MSKTCSGTNLQITWNCNFPIFCEDSSIPHPKKNCMNSPFIYIEILHSSSLRHQPFSIIQFLASPQGTLGLPFASKAAKHAAAPVELPEGVLFLPGLKLQHRNARCASAEISGSSQSSIFSWWFIVWLVVVWWFTTTGNFHETSVSGVFDEFRWWALWFIPRPIFPKSKIPLQTSIQENTYYPLANSYHSGWKVRSPTAIHRKKHRHQQMVDG